MAGISQLLEKTVMCHRLMASMVNRFVTHKHCDGRSASDQFVFQFRMCASTHCDCYRLDGYNQPDWLTKMTPTSATTAAVKSHYTTTTTDLTYTPLSNIQPRSKVRHTTSRPRTSHSSQSGTSTTSQSRQQDSVSNYIVFV